MKFSQRIGLVPVKNTLQLEGMDNDLKNGLWNVFYSTLPIDVQEFYNILIADFFKEKIDDRRFEMWIPLPGEREEEIIKSLKRRFDKFSWYEVYDFIEFVINSDIWDDKKKIALLVKRYNLCLKNELSGYRIVEKK